MAALLAVQPLLDVLSYFMGQAEATWVTTALRTVLLFAVCLARLCLTENRRAYSPFGVVGGLWVLHMLNSCAWDIRPGGDAAEFLKLVQFPLVDPFLSSLFFASAGTWITGLWACWR